VRRWEIWDAPAHIYRYGEKISTAFVESTANEVISKRMILIGVRIIHN